MTFGFSDWIIATLLLAACVYFVRRYILNNAPKCLTDGAPMKYMGKIGREKSEVWKCRKCKTEWDFYIPHPFGHDSIYEENGT